MEGAALKSLLNLWCVLAVELASICHTSAQRDIGTVSLRVEREGFSFLTITLPAFCKDFERSLDQGAVSDDLFLSFRKDASGLPRFLGGFLQNVFDEHAVLRNTTDALTDSISAIRQLTRLFAKIQLPCTKAREKDAVEAFILADQETGQWDESSSQELMSDFKRVSRILFGDALSHLDRQIWLGELTPKHGPGAVSEGLRGNAKFDLTEWPERLNDFFPFWEWAVASPRFGYRGARVQFPPPESERPSRMILVPKTMKAPRVIAAEPSALQYMQQALSQELVESLEMDPLVGDPLAKMRYVTASDDQSLLGFSRAMPNQHLASVGSVTGSLATLDMSEASDRVSLGQVVALLDCAPWTREAVLSTRSLRVQLTDEGGVMPLRKFASMGSALCFPIEAMVFLTAVFMGIERKLVAEGFTTQLNRRTVKRFKGSVRVYGDDIIVPVDCVPAVSEIFTLLGWKINSGKSFWTGKFRESCGGDFYDGVNVTPTYVRREFPPGLRASADEAASIVALRNQFYLAGLWRTVIHLDRIIEKSLRFFPVVCETSPLLGRVSFLPFVGERYDVELHRPLVKGWLVSPRIPKSPISDEGALLKCLLASYDDPKHLYEAGRPSVVDLKLRWMPPY